ncbi:MAG TPA: methyltransferase domain-containing protein [Bryobacteraceae bacterium]
MFAQRLIQAESLDRLPPEEARLNLAELVRINRHFGGHAVIRRTLARAVERRDKFTLLDIGAASGDTARLIETLYPAASVTSLDCKASHLSAAHHPKIAADAFELPFRTGSFDFVLCSLFLHHFPDKQASQLLGIFYAIARRGLLICDLERRVVPYFFLPATKFLLGWSGVTVHDGMRSVRASFRPRELLKLARRAGIPQARVEVHRPAFRISLMAEKADFLRAQLGRRD